MSQTRSTSGTRPGTAALERRGSVFFDPPMPNGWAIAGGELSLDSPLVMGILNLTPDSFSDGGALPDLDAALAQARAMVEEGAGILDVGGESTRPGADAVPVEEELRRVLPFVRAAVGELEVPISVDTRKAAVARAVLDAGARVINDVSGFQYDPDLPPVVADAGAGVVLMHMRGDPHTMRSLTRYGRVADEVYGELMTSVHIARDAGVPSEAIVVDPGIGFAKTAAQSLELLRDLATFSEAGLPVLIGPSRKSFLGAALGLPAGERLEGTLAACVAGYLAGARIFRVHDVGPAVRALTVAHAVLRPEIVE